MIKGINQNLVYEWCFWTLPSKYSTQIYGSKCNTDKRGVIALDANHDDVIKWKHFLRYWPFLRGINRSPVTSPYKGQWRGTLLFYLMFYLIWTLINGSVKNREAGDLRRHHAHYGVIVMCSKCVGEDHDIHQHQDINGLVYQNNEIDIPICSC